MKKTLLCLLSLLPVINALAQPMPYNTRDFVNINNIKASVLVHGDMWWDPLTQASNCYFPATSTKTISFNAALWMSGYDASSQLHVSSQMYRQNGNDYWPGPIDSTTGILDSTTSSYWNKIWKVNKSTIDSFRMDTNAHTITNTPSVILRWPAKGNVYAQGFGGTPLTINRDMAPFVDRNGNGIYEPLLGEYPKIKGDQALWWIVSDKGPTHSESNGLPLGVEIRTMAYAYKRNTLIDNVIYYDYNVVNRSSNNYSNFRIGQFADMDMGAPYDDYVGFDSARRMGIIYNGSIFDTLYNYNIPIAGITMIILPGDAGTTYVPAGSFLYFNNDLTTIGNPSLAAEYDNYLRSKDRIGNHLVNDYVGPGTPTTGFGAGPNTNYVFPGDPGNSAQWSECSSVNTPGDRRFVIASNDFTLNAGQTQHILMALVTTDTDTSNACGRPSLGFDGIRTVADTAWGVFINPPIDTVHDAGTHNVATTSHRTINVFPNPAHDRIYLESNIAFGNEAQVQVYNSVGQQVAVQLQRNGTRMEVNISTLPAGLYSILYRDGSEYHSSMFVRQ